MRMAVSMFTRLLNIRNVMNINNFNAAGSSISIIQRSDVISKSYSSVTSQGEEDVNLLLSDEIYRQKVSEKKLNKAMKAYMQRSKDYKEFIERQVAEYNIGKRHLANMMGLNPEEISKKDIKESIEYLFPSGIYDKLARPMMIPPEELHKRKEAEFDESGRPHHFLFYTAKPNYYEILHKIAGSMIYLNKIEDKKVAMNIELTPENKINLVGFNWLSKIELETLLLEELKPEEYEYFVKSMDILVDHPLSKHVESFVMTYRKQLTTITKKAEIPKLEYDSNNRPFIVAISGRKSAKSEVKIIGEGSGNITINGKDITYFDNIQCREQIIFPLIFTHMNGKIDIEAKVYGGGPSGQAGAIRHAISKALRSFVDEQMIEKMRLAGLLTVDWRKRERKKWGQEGARRRFTWKKR
ncbi:28S ribosomal protein S9, mitochondrial-like isoform X2 [Ceratina calcarata]|uniref:Small ribosomal subunit protein uS9m n=1 Tax=Ceratina calcarata TaxID=156304 RepID=A0AAJ7IUG6_9HYME|nr:28S ribosomal protein S9, mitochondrial-like isoform X2 [Ceratina calcarata]